MAITHVAIRYMNVTDLASENGIYQSFAATSQCPPNEAVGYFIYGLILKPTIAKRSNHGLRIILGVLLEHVSLVKVSERLTLRLIQILSAERKLHC
jgi:hypothetical protein